MANTGRSRSSGSSRGSKSSTSKKSTRSSGSRSTSRKTTTAPVQTESGASSLFKKFASSRAAMPVIFIAASLLIVGIDLLISWNSYQTFFKILGVEVLLAVVVWVILTLVYSGKNKKGADSISSEDEV
jgi:Na+-translocating ferredoxin:NAD+ oxidoreductase RnfE subunit